MRDRTDAAAPRAPFTPGEALAGRPASLARRRVAAAAVVVLIAALVAASAARFHELEVAQRWVEHTGQVQADVSTFLSAVVELSTSARGYAVTGDPRLRAAAADAERSVAERLAALRARTADNAEQQRRLDRLEALARELGGAEAQVMATGGAAPSRAVALQEMTAFQRVRAVAVEMRGAEQRLFAARAAASRAESHRLAVAAGLLAAALVVAAAGLLVLERREASLRAAAHAALRRSELLHRAMAQHLPNGAVLLFDHALRHVLVGGSQLADVGGREGLEGRALDESFPPEVAARLEPVYRAALAGAPAATELARRGRTLEVRAIPVTDDAGQPIYGLAMTQDVTERRRQADVLAASVREKEHLLGEVQARERWLETTLHSLADGVLAADAGGRVVLANPRAEELTGVRAQEARGRAVSEVLPLLDERDRRPLPCPAQEALRRGEVVELPAPALLAAPGAVERPVEATAAPIRDAHGAPLGVAVVFRDVAGRRSAEAQLAGRRRLAALDTLIAGLAHEINNPLASGLANERFVLDALRDLLRRLEGAEPVAPAPLAGELRELVQALEDGQAGGERIARLVRELRRLTRPAQARARIQLLDVLEGALRATAHVTRGRAVVEREPGVAPAVMGSAEQLEHVVSDLLANAAQAIPPGRIGRIALRLGTSPDGWARVEVEDDGEGVDERVKDRIFDPFVTTRPEGSGLGLYGSHAIVVAHGGRLTFTSQRGVGATFRMDLPPAPPPSADA